MAQYNDNNVITYVYHLVPKAKLMYYDSDEEALIKSSKSLFYSMKACHILNWFHGNLKKEQ